MSVNTIMIYTEQTPNPESLKFVLNKMLHKGTLELKTEEEANGVSLLASELFRMPYVKSVYICNNFVTITKEFNYNWEDIMLQIKEFIKTWVYEEKEIVNAEYVENKLKESILGSSDNHTTSDNQELAIKIKDLIDTYVKPAVENDGGNIEFRSFVNGIVTVLLQGSCSGCPSSTVTLKAGIEGMLKRMIPEVKEVVSEMG